MVIFGFATAFFVGTNANPIEVIKDAIK